MFKGMDGQSVHVIGIIKNGYNPTEHPERILSYQPSWSFGVLIAFSNSSPPFRGGAGGKNWNISKRGGVPPPHLEIFQLKISGL